MATKKKKKQELISDDAFMALNTANLRPIQETYEETAARHKQEKAKKKQESTFSAFNDGYDFGDVTRTILKGGKKLGQATVGSFKKSSYFDDGYDFGDLTKASLYTATSLVSPISKGILKGSESLSDWGYNKIGDIAWQLGNMDVAMSNWEKASRNDTQDIEQSLRHILVGDVGGDLSNKQVNQAFDEADEEIRKKGFISEKGQQTAEEIARMATIAGYGSLTGGQAGTDLLFYASAASNAENEARMAGATPEEAWRYSILNGTAEMLTEKMFGGLGKISDHLGVSKGIAEQFTNKLTNKITNTFFRNLAEYGISATGEGFEEVASGFLDAYAKKLTYMKDADIKQLLADQDLMEQFVQGTVTSFFMQTPNFVKSNIAKVDYKTGYTKNEQQVVDKLIQERVDEASKDGKVSGKKYAEIRDKVNEDLKNGDIKVRDIERLLGGETYTNYQNALAEDNKINKRLDELNQKIDEYENLSASEKLSRANEYKQWETELESITEEKNRSIENTSNLQRQLSSEVYNLAGKDSNFARSYQDEAQKSVAFNKNQYDYDNLSDNKKALLDSAVNANANNTKAIHKLTQGIMDMMNAEDSFKYEFVNDDMLRESGLSDQTKYKVTSRDTLESIANKNNMTVEQLKKLNNNISSVKAGQELNVYSKNITNGLVIKKDNKILINLDAVNRLETVVGHEMTHLIEKMARGKATGEYGDYRKSLFEYAEKKGDLEKIRKEFERLYKDQNLTQEELDQEITAELSGRYLFSDEKFLKLVAEDRANTKIRDFIDDLVVKFTGTEEEQQLRELQKKYRDAYQNRNKSFKEGENSRKIQLSKSEIQGLEGYSRQEIKSITNDYIQQKLLENGIDDVTIIDSDIHGSRNRGTARADSDLDLVVQYEGDIREDDFFNMLNDNGDDNLYIEGIKVDINPIQEDLSSYMERSNQYDEEIKSKNTAEFKQKQNDIIQQNNPLDTSLGVHTWINSADDIKTYQEALDYDEYENGNLTPDFTESMVKKALDTGKITVYSSYPIKQGTFVTPSKMEAQSYAGNSQVYSKEVNLNDVAWIDSLQGQYANVGRNIETKYSLSSTDSQGRELTKEQKDFFKKSKATDENGNLKVLYHGSQTAGFYDFSPQEGKGHYRFGDNTTVTFLTDSWDAAKSYTPSGERVDTRRLESVNDAKSWLKGITEDYYIEGTSVYDIDGEQVLEYKTDEDLIKNLKRDMQKEVGNTEAGGIYEVYANITKPYVVKNKDGYAHSWSEVAQDHSPEIKDFYRNLSENDKLAIKDAMGWEDWGMFKDELTKYYTQKYVDGSDPKSMAYLNYGTENAYEYDYGNTMAELGKKLHDLYSPGAQEGSIDIKALSDLHTIAEFDYSEQAIKERAFRNLTTNDIVNQVLEMNKNGSNYDGIIFENINDIGSWESEYADMNSEEGDTVYVALNSNQVKATDNTNPTSNPDIRYSLSEAPKQDNKGRELSKDQQEFFKNVAPQLRDENGNIKTFYHGTPAGDFTVFREGSYFSERPDYASGYENTWASSISSGKEATNPKTYEVYLNITNPFTLSNQTAKDIYINEYIKGGNSAYYDPYTDYTDTINQLDEIDWVEGEDLKEWLQENHPEFDGLILDEGGDGGYGEAEYRWRGLSYVPFNSNQVKNVDNLNPTDNPDIRYSLSDPNNIAPLGEGTYSQDVKLQETQMDRIENQLNELSNTLERINNNIPRETNVDVDGFDLNLEPFMDMINGSTQAEADMRNVTQTRQNIENNLKLINDNFDRIKGTLVEQGLPVDAAQDFIENVVNKYDRQYRETLENSGKNNKIEKMLLDAQEKFTNRNAWIDKLSKDSGNENIKLLGDMANNSFQEASTNINRFQTDLNGKKIGKGIKDIFKVAKQEGLGAAFEDYLFSLSNIERHAVGKGSRVPSEVSERLVKDYEASHPEFKAWAQDIRNYYDNLLTQEVKSGLIDQDTYNLLRGEQGIYRSYVPFYPSDAEKRYFDNAGNLKPAQTLKRAKGGAGQIMGIEEAMGKQTMAVWNSIRTNQLYQEIINTIGGEEGFGAIIRNEPSNLDQSLYTDTDGNRFLTAFVDGREMTAQISEDLYNELSRNGENRIKALEERYSAITKPLQKLSNLRRNILTSYNPTFALFKNPIKDIQDAVLYSRHTADMLKNLPSAYKELWTGNTETVQQFLALYGSNEYQGIGKGYAKVSEMIELAPRYAEFKASLQNGDSVAKAIYNARDITTNFGRGGYVTKALNRNGFTFLNASVQGFSKLVRNFTEQPNARQFAMAVGKAALLGIVPAVFNELAFGSGDDKDEDYEALPDYIKDNYYIFKLGDNADYDDGTGAVISVGGSKFLRIPKGRALSIFGSAARRTIELAEGDENAFEGYLENAWSQVGPVEIAANPLDNTIFAPIAQVAGGEKTSGGNTTGRAWYGGDIVPTRLQGEKPEDQYDASVDKFSIWLGQKTGWSPYKINYVLDQYSGGIGDVILPMLTEETKNGAETPLDYLIAPVRDQLVVNSIDDNKYASEFYSTKEKLYKGSKATDEEKLRAQYMDDVSWDLSSLYKEKRAVQSDNSLSKKEKYAKVQAIQAQINDIARTGLNMSKTIDVSGSYASVSDDRAYYKNAKGQWTAIPQDDLTTVESLGMTDAEKSNYFDASNALYNIYNKYKEKKEGKSETEQIELNIKQKKERLDTIKNSPLSDNAKYALFDKSYDDKLLSYYEDLGFKANDVLTYKSQTFTADKDKNGKTINNSKKKKVVKYINSMNIPTIQKKILYKRAYKSDKSYDREIFNYINNSDMDYSSKKAVLKELGINAR